MMTAVNIKAITSKLSPNMNEIRWVEREMRGFVERDERPGRRGGVGVRQLRGAQRSLQRLL
jgi:hypothetical protein